MIVRGREASLDRGLRWRGFGFDEAKLGCLGADVMADVIGKGVADADGDVDVDANVIDDDEFVDVEGADATLE